MPHRLEVMLTSRRSDGIWTWRAAGARQPKGVLEPELLPAGAAVGDVLRVEADVSVDGISVRQVLPAKADKPEPPRVEHIGGQRFTEGVTGPSRITKEGGDRGDRRPGRRGEGGRQRRDGGGGRGRRDDGRPQRSGSGHRGGRGDRPQRAPRLRSGSEHRDAWLATLEAEQRAVAERLANEGIRAVRQATQEEFASAAGQEATESGEGAEARLAVVEEVFEGLRAADWRDRAEAARGVCDDVELRDLRSVVAGTPQNIASEELRGLADELRKNLVARVDREHSAWIADLGSLLRKGRVITALRVSQRPPKTGTPLPESLAGTLQSSAASQLTADAEDDLWVRMLEAAAQSPIRLVLVAGSVPAEPSERLLRTVRRFGDRLPALRAQFAEHLEPAAEPEPPAADAPVEAEPEPPAADAPAETESPTEGEPSGEDPGAASVESAAQGDTPAEVAAAADPSAAGVPDADVTQELPQAAGEVEVVELGQ
ncbi:MAG: hypothetical protein J4F99_01280 [Acidimicrobiia bacterium]|nr:hypothetical protein [Acidimicrobiia bacterium]